MENIIVTGCSGFIGGRFAYYLASHGYQIIAPLRPSSIPLINHKNIRSVNYKDVDKFCEEIKITEIIHCASLTPVNTIDSGLLMQTNSELASYISGWITIGRPRLVVFMSSIIVYGNIKEKILKFNTAYNVPNTYGISKVKVENELQVKCDQIGSHFINFRLPGVIGYGSHSNLISKIIKMMMMPAYLEQKITLTNPNSQFNNIVFISNLIECYIYLSRKILAEEKIKDLSFLWASDQPIKFIDVMSQIGKILDCNPEDYICWSDNTTQSFTIDIKKGKSQGLIPLNTVDSITAAVYDIKHYRRIS